MHYTDEINSFLKNHSEIRINESGLRIYVRTPVGCWKIKKKENGKYMLLHKNHVEGMIDLCDVEKGKYHVQRDFSTSKNMMDILQYIERHDRYKMTGVSNLREMPTKTKRQKSVYKAAKNKIRKDAVNRVYDLFAQLELQAQCI